MKEAKSACPNQDWMYVLVLLGSRSDYLNTVKTSLQIYVGQSFWKTCQGCSLKFQADGKTNI